MLKRFAIFSVLMLLVLVLFEGFLRFSPFRYGLSPVQFDENVGYWHKPGFSSWSVRSCYSTKFRFDENGAIPNSYEFDPGKKTVVILGDSFIEALMVNNENVIHNALWDETGGHFNYVNYALGGISPLQMFLVLQHKVNLENSAGILHFINIDNDLDDVDPANLGGFQRPRAFLDFTSLDDYRFIPPVYDWKERLRDTLSGLETYFFLKTVIFHTREKMTELREGKKPEAAVDTEPMPEAEPTGNMDKNWLQMKGVVYQTRNYLQQRGLDYSVVIISDPWRKTNNAAILSDFLDEQNIPHFYLNPLAETMGLPLEGYDCDVHWNDQSHRNLAKIVASQLSADLLTQEKFVLKKESR